MAQLHNFSETLNDLISKEKALHFDNYAYSHHELFRITDDLKLIQVESIEDALNDDKKEYCALIIYGKTKNQDKIFNVVKSLFLDNNIPSGTKLKRNNWKLEIFDIEGGKFNLIDNNGILRMILCKGYNQKTTIEAGLDTFNLLEFIDNWKDFDEIIQSYPVRFQFIENSINNIWNLFLSSKNVNNIEKLSHLLKEIKEDKFNKRYFDSGTLGLKNLCDTFKKLEIQLKLRVAHIYFLTEQKDRAIKLYEEVVSSSRMAYFFKIEDIIKEDLSKINSYFSNRSDLEIINQQTKIEFY